jgi:glycosyltransferase involved in cell wall biosynthesis
MRVLVFAYGCEPGQGSEPGAGWIWSRMLARLGDVWIITRESNREAIEAALPATPERERMHFEYVDLPDWARSWKRGTKGARLYYLLWQGSALRRARLLSRREPFDLTWHLTWANAWLGALAPLLPFPFVYGPVGGGVGMDWSLASSLGTRGVVIEAARASVRTVARYANPLARLPWARAELILVQNPETRSWLPVRHREKTVVFPHVVLDRPGVDRRPPRTDRPPVALFVGRLLPWKGVALALRTLVLLEEWTLLVCGSGPDRSRLEHLAVELGVQDRVRFLGWAPPSRVEALMRSQADVLLFPSIHDEGGFVVAEALAVGLPVVCLARGGPPEIGGIGVAPTDVVGTVSRLAEAVRGTANVSIPPFPDLESSTARLRALLESRLPQLVGIHGEPARSDVPHPLGPRSASSSDAASYQREPR